MKNFSEIAKFHKNQVEASYPYIFLFEFEDNGTPTKRYRFTNFDQIVYFGRDDDGAQIEYYPALVFSGDLEENSDGDLKQVSVNVGLPGPISAKVTDENRGFAGNQMRVIVVSSLDLDSEMAIMDEYGEITSSAMSNEGISFNIGGSNLFRLIFPSFIYSPWSCKWAWAGEECGYNLNTASPGYAKCGITTGGVQTARPYSFQACRLVGADELAQGIPVRHPGRFGGEPGMTES